MGKSREILHYLTGNSCTLIAVLLTIFCLFCVPPVAGGCTRQPGFDASLRSIVEPYRFSYLRWEIHTLPAEINPGLATSIPDPENGMPTVSRYFRLVEQVNSLKSGIDAVNSGVKTGDVTALRAELEQQETEKSLLTREVEDIIACQIKEALAGEGIYNPVTGCRWHFPPVSFRLENLPYLLVVSPRDRIESIREITLKQDITLRQMTEIESKVDGLGVSSLVEALGGYGGTFPTIVTDDADLRFTLDTAVEEWLHQYLAFTPLGFRYVLDVTGIARNYEIATINESVAGMVSREIGEIIRRRYYAQDDNTAVKSSNNRTGFDFNREMREIRQTVDRYLAQGQIEPAERFMEQQRQYLATQGYYIRKLNQAYFAFHGAYADKPTSIDPIGAELKTLRDRSASLKEFLDKVSAMTGRRDLQNAIR